MTHCYSPPRSAAFRRRWSESSHIPRGQPQESRPRQLDIVPAQASHNVDRAYERIRRTTSSTCRTLLSSSACRRNATRLMDAIWLWSAHLLRERATPEPSILLPHRAKREGLPKRRQPDPSRGLTASQAARRAGLSQPRLDPLSSKRANPASRVQQRSRAVRDRLALDRHGLTFSASRQARSASVDAVGIPKHSTSAA
jgi:hypothetical protein